MTHINPGGETRPATPLLSHTTPQLHLGLDRLRLHEAIATRRLTLATLETAMVNACEQQAVRGAGRHIQIHDRETWDKPTWNRYLAAATACEADYMPQMLRLLREIDQLQRLMALPLAETDHAPALAA